MVNVKRFSYQLRILNATNSSAPYIKSLNVALLLFAWYLKGTKKVECSQQIISLCFNMILVWNVASFDIKTSLGHRKFAGLPAI